ncbi:hypothetical protein FisN_13Lh053 [Fistulifera solaris]|uniref:Uncharacterized protein n=1 Tax=Fistulifera solaris TaxID=1519565 RepID=A0A1Z5JF11_FISSO|nr:hypothetical protein FisN_13Lh053 [Fistulifera solaris]|eukprot:GAX12594.1 hypothetical protein FisN_13Lh053 [Fistulifera solaris]
MEDDENDASQYDKEEGELGQDEIGHDEEELLLLVSSSRKDDTKQTPIHCRSRSTVQTLLLVWVITAILFYEIGQWKCQTRSKNNHSTTFHEATTISHNITNNNHFHDNTEYPLDQPFSPFGIDRKDYRRVCAHVHSSELCLTLRFPFAVEPQDPQFEYPHPVQERMYDLDATMHTLDGADLIQCRQDTAAEMTNMNEKVVTCLERWTLTQTNPSNTVVGVWTRTELKPTRGETDFYGVQLSEEQGQRIDDFFKSHVIVVLGASPTPAVTECLSSLFGRCRNGGIKPLSSLCEGHYRMLQDRDLGNLYTYGTLPENETFIGVMGYYPNDDNHGRHHSLSVKDIPELIRGPDFQRPNSLIKRKLSFIIDHPIAHVQNENMIVEEWNTIAAIQQGYPQQIMNIYSPEGRKILSEAGWEPGHVIAFDGIPQFNPSKTGAFDWSLKTIRKEEKFIANKGYDGWMEDYGTKCRGPLPPQSALKKVNELAREGYQNAGLDPNFYGRTWEFANQFWFAVKGWTKDKGLDCTHAKQNGTGLSCVHKYFLQLMIDDHYRTIEERREIR